MLRRHNNKLVFLSCFRGTTNASDGASQAVLGPRRKDNITNLSALGVSPSQSQIIPSFSEERSLGGSQGETFALGIHLLCVNFLASLRSTR